MDILIVIPASALPSTAVAHTNGFDALEISGSRYNERPQASQQNLEARKSK